MSKDAANIDELDTAMPEASPPLPVNRSPEALRALAEAAERKAKAIASEAPPPEINGRGGPEPVRYGDWEVKGIASDF